MFGSGGGTSQSWLKSRTVIVFDISSQNRGRSRVPYHRITCLQRIVASDDPHGMTTTDKIPEKFRHLNLWKRGDERAPHKPLLVLLALGRLQAGDDRLLPYDEIDRPLACLLTEFGPPRKSPHPELPFFHLQTACFVN
jgi:hypothetical protein